MYANKSKLLGVAFAAAIAATVFGVLFALQLGVNLAFASNNQIAPNEILTEVVASTCQISLSPSAFTFANVVASGNTVTTPNSVLDTNNGNAQTYLWVYGSNWIGPNGILPTFGVGSTVFSSAASTGYGSATALTLISQNTAILDAAASSANVFFGLGIPTGQAANTYTQNIIITNVC